MTRLNTIPAVARDVSSVLKLFFLGLILVLEVLGNDSVTLKFSPTEEDMTLIIREALEKVDTRHLRIEFASGSYEFHEEYAEQAYYAITNHDNGLKRIIFPLDRFDSVEIIGDRTELIFHGRVLPFLLDGCESVQMSGLTIDWAVPYYFQALVEGVNEGEGWFEVTPSDAGGGWRIHNEALQFPMVKGFSYAKPGETLAFDAQEKRVYHGTWDFHLSPNRVELLRQDRLRIHAKLKHFPKEGSVIVSKGAMGENRYAPAVYGVGSKNVQLKDITIHHALGMGFLFERCDTVTLSNCDVLVRAGSGRMVSTLADATHFCNCKGDILMENCRFQHMLDDGTNVHGTYVEVDEVLNANEVRVKLKHFQQRGFQFAEPGDQIWLIQAPDPRRGPVKTVSDYRSLNEEYSVITFDEAIDGLLKRGDVLENKTWNPTFTMRGCHISDHRARGIVLKTPRSILIEENYFSSMMSAIFFRGESFHWFESGSVEDVLIQNNRFEYCAYSGMEHAVLKISPRLGGRFDTKLPYDRNIQFRNNQIQTFGTRIVWAHQTDGLDIIDNRIVQVEGPEVLYVDSPAVELINCENVRISGNSYTGTKSAVISYDKKSKETTSISNNNGFVLD
jgi:hypothetical protein